MLSIINIILAILWFFSAIVDYSDFCYIWQLKEYRWDRMKDFFSTKQGQDFWKRYILLWRSLVAIIIFFWPINSILVVKYFLIGIFSAEFIKNIFLARRRKLRRPIFTKKAIIITGFSIIVEGSLFLIAKDWALLFLLIILRPIIISFATLVLNQPTKLAKKYYIKKATSKMLLYKNKLRVIGITGSYGKTSVKTFLSHILGKKYNVASTPKNINTEIGIAKFILKSNFKNVDIFIVEMGAYRKGEIKLISDMVKPEIGILTAITEQHLSLFGDIKQTQSAKYELLRSLPKNGLAVVNLDNPYCREYIDDLDCQVLTFGIDSEFSPTCLIQDIITNKDGVVCSGIIDKKEWQISTPIIGEHNATNFAPCILVAHYLGMTNEEIVEQCKTLESPERTLKIYKYGKSTILDDSYNANLNGFCAALDALSAFPVGKTKVVITRGIPELGLKSDEIHEKIGEEIAYSADMLVIINRDFEAPLRRGVGNKYNTEVILIEDQNKLLEFAKSLKNKDTVILLENRLPEKVYRELII